MGERERGECLREKEDRDVGGTEREECVREDTGVGERERNAGVLEL